MARNVKTEVPHARHILSNWQPSPRRRRGLAAPQAQTKEVKDDMGGRQFDSSTIGKEQIEVPAVGAARPISTCMKQAEDPQGLPLGPRGSKGPVYQEVQSIRSAVAAATASVAAAASNVQSRHHKNRRCYIVSATYVQGAKEEPCYIYPLLKTGTTYLCMVTFLASRKSAVFCTML